MAHSGRRVAGFGAIVRDCRRRGHPVTNRNATRRKNKKTSHSKRRNPMAYHLEGRLLEVCDCRVLCPCWIGEDPDNGTCDSVLAYHFDRGTIDGVDIAGRTLALVSHIPGNVLNGNFRVALYLDQGTSDAQQEALLNVYTGKLGGPIADFAKLVGEVVSVERAPITFDVNEGRGTLTISNVSPAELEPIRGRTARRRCSATRSSRPFPARRFSSARQRRIARSMPRSGMISNCTVITRCRAPSSSTRDRMTAAAVRGGVMGTRRWFAPIAGM